MSSFIRLLIISLLLGSNVLWAQNKVYQFKSHWIDSVYNKLTDDQRLGQLFMVAAYSGGEKKNESTIDQLISKGIIGGLIFMQGTAEEQARQTNKYQKNSPVKLLISMDAEWGLGMRLTGVKDYPKQMSVGATQDSLLMYNIGVAIAKQCKRLGVHINFAPCVDINNNPLNPVINFRSFGADKELVSRLGIAYMKGLQNNGVIACAKHFPGHGDVTVDSHEDLPVINKSKTELTELELYPFKRLISEGIQSVMVAHLSVPSLDPTPKHPSSVSKSIVTDLLKNEMKFNGLILTDALNMKGLTKNYAKGEADLLALIAGNDILLFSEDVGLAIEKIKFAILVGQISKEAVEQKVKKILAVKYDLGLTQFIPINPQNVTEDLNKQVDSFLKVTARASGTVVKDQNQIISKNAKNKDNYFYIAVNASDKRISELKQLYGVQNVINIATKTSSSQIKTLLAEISKKQQVIIGIHNLNRYPGKENVYGLDAQQVSFLKEAAEKNNVLFAVLGTPYITHIFAKTKSLYIGYEDNEYTNMVAYAIFKNQYKAIGKLPVTLQFGKKKA